MPRHKITMKDVARLRKDSGSCLASFDPNMCEWVKLCAFGGNPDLALGSKPGEAKPFSTRSKRK